MTNPQAYLINKYNYFKLRDVAYLLRNSTAEFEVGWEKSTNVITLTTGKNYTAVGGELNTKALSSAAGKPTTAIVKVNGKKVSFDGYIINGNNYYKIADMAAALGFTADYDVPSRTVSLKTPTPAPITILSGDAITFLFSLMYFDIAHLKSYSPCVWL